MPSKQRIGSKHQQHFEAAWPTVLDDMYEYIALTHLTFGSSRSGSVEVNLSRRLVQPNELQPYIQNFQCNIEKNIPQLQVKLHALDIPAHQVEINHLGM